MVQNVSRDEERYHGKVLTMNEVLSQYFAAALPRCLCSNWNPFNLFVLTSIGATMSGRMHTR